MNENLKIAFEECLAAYEQGASLEDCLQLHPELADELQPQLLAIIKIRTLAAAVPLPSHSQAKSKAQFLQRADGNPFRQAESKSLLVSEEKQHGKTAASDQRHPAHWGEFLTRLLMPLTSKPATVLLIFFILVLTGSGVLNASAQSLPGDPFYGIKRTLEDARISLSTSGENRARLEDQVMENRRQETLKVTENHRKVALEFGGLLDKVDGERWSVGGVTVIVPDTTPIQGVPQPGLYLYIHGETQDDGSLLASEITVQGFVFTGRIEQIQPGFWLIDGKTVYRCDDTQIEGALNTGSLVEVNAALFANGDLLAERIRVKAGGADQKATKNSEDSGKDGSNPVSTRPSSDGDPLPRGGDDQDGSKDGINPAGIPEPTRTPLPAQGNDPSATNTPHDNNSGETDPARTPMPTQTAQPTKTPNSGGGSSGQATSSPIPQEVRFQGIVQSIGSSIWTVSGQYVTVTSSSEIDHTIKVGDSVEVRAMQQPDGKLVATRIQKK